MNINLFADGPTLQQLTELNKERVKGYTFNPSLFGKIGAKDYLDFSKEILNLCGVKPVSLEVISDDEKGMIRQAEILNSLGKNVYVKVPICFTSGESTKNVIKDLVKKNIKLNITAIFMLNQIDEIIELIKDTETILSVFIGRIYDAGIDGYQTMLEVNKYVHNKSKCKTLWASTRMAYDIIKAEKSNTDIITVSVEHLKKMEKFGYDLNQYSIDTVKQFHNDAKSSGFNF